MVERRGNGDRRLARLTEANARLRRKLAEQASLWQIAHEDPLTGLWNRRYADDRLAEELLRAGDVAGYRFSLVVADVNDLKRINDERGHAAGDQALKWVAQFLAGILRANDVCCRLGGDEFLLILPHTGADECRDFIKRLRRECQREARAYDQAVAMSLGTATYPIDGATVEALCAVADASMYEEKRRRGRRPPTARATSSDAAAGADLPRGPRDGL